SLLLPEINTNFDFQYYLVPTFEAWLRKQFVTNARYDRMVRDLLTTSMGPEQQQFFRPYGDKKEDLTPIAFFRAKESKPENLAASTARLFLGIKIECAQCHNHPFAPWTRNQFWEYAAFFAGFEGGGQNFFAMVRETPDRRELAISGTNQVVQAAFL